MNERFDSQSQRLIAMGQMAASLAHEIRNPLGSMELYCSLLKKDLTNQPSSFELAERIHDGIRRLEQIINNSLQFSRDVRLQLEAVDDVHTWLEGLIRAVKDSTRMSDLTVVSSVEPGVNLRCDRCTMQQVISNVLRNALEAVSIRKDNIDPAVTIVVRRGVNCSHISVADNGVGMSEHTCNHLFDPFYSTKKDGTGLGLSVVHMLVNAHGGKIEVDSKEGVGTEFTITIPHDYEAGSR